MSDIIATRAEVQAELARATEYIRQLNEHLRLYPVETDYVEVRFGGGFELYTYRIDAQPTSRRVQVGDLITVPATGSTRPQPQVVRVEKVNSPAPTRFTGKRAVAISPEDAARIERVVGKVR